MSNKYFNSLLNKYKEYSNSDIERNAIYLDSIYKFCSKNNIRLILLTVPCWNEYLSMIDKRRLSLVYDIMRKYEQMSFCECGDYLFDNRFIFNGSLYRNANHLSDFGSERFTKVIKKDFSL